MFHFFGIFDLGPRKQTPGAEAPHKKAFFGPNAPTDSHDDPLSTAAQDALILTGKQPKAAAKEHSFARSLR